MTKHTAIETMAFLLELEIGELVPDQKLERIHKIIKHAKAMEKEQIEQAFVDGVDSGSLMDANTYYQKTYGGNK